MVDSSLTNMRTLVKTPGMRVGWAVLVVLVGKVVSAGSSAALVVTK